MTAPKPEALRHELSKVVNQTTVLFTEYRWAHDLGFTADRRGRSQEEQEGGGASHSRQSMGEYSNATLDIVGSKQKRIAREKCEAAMALVKHAADDLQSAIFTCRQAMKDPHEPAEEPISMASLVTRAEKAALLEAQQRRRARNEDLTGPSLTERQPK